MFWHMPDVIEPAEFAPIRGKPGTDVAMIYFLHRILARFVLALPLTFEAVLFSADRTFT